MNCVLQFLSELTRFFQKSKASSKSVQLTMKKCNKMLHFYCRCYCCRFLVSLGAGICMHSFVTAGGI